MPTRRTRTFRRALPLLVAALAIAALRPSVSNAQDAPPAGSRLLVVHKNGSRLLVVDPTTQQLLGSVPTGADPHEVAVSPDGRTAYVTNYGPPGQPGTSISIIDIASRTETRRLALSNLPRPHGVAQVDGKIYFTAELANAVGRFNPATGELDKTFDTFQPASHQLAVSRIHKRIYTANVIADSVTAIDIVDNGAPARTRVIPVGPGPEGIDVTPDGAEVWAAQLGDGAISVIDGNTLTVKATIQQVGVQPIRLRFTPDGSRAVVTDPQGGQIVVIDRATRQVLRRINSNGGPFGVAFTPDGRRAYVGLGGAGALAVIDMEALAPLGTIPLGSPGVDGVEWVAPPAAGNPIEDASFFVRQQYRDFLLREPEAAGQAAWEKVLRDCANNDPACDRVTVSASFFLSEEFLTFKGFFVHRFYAASFGRLPLYGEFMPDMLRVTGQTSDDVLARRDAFTNEWVERAEFKAAYGGLSNADFVDKLARTAGVELPNRDQLVADLDANAKTRAQVVRAVAESDALRAKEFRRAFVAMQYFGYLRRDPEETGFNAWLGHLNQNPQDFRTMVTGFVNSVEYRLRFGAR